MRLHKIDHDLEIENNESESLFMMLHRSRDQKFYDEKKLTELAPEH